MTYTDVTPLACLISEYYVFAINADSPIKTRRDFIETRKFMATEYERMKRVMGVLGLVK